MELLRKLERTLLTVGVLMLGFYVGALVSRSVLSNAELERFESPRQVSADESQPVALTTAVPDFRSWSEHRVRAYQESLAADFAPAIGVLRIPRIHIEVPILEGTDDLSLNRGVGHVAGTASPWEEGNIAIAGHRDGFFRGLKDIGVGDRVEMVTRDRTQVYVIDRILIVDPSDVSVLRPRADSSLTLITCYPFYFIGSAPKRYIVQASLTNSAPAHIHTLVEPESAPEVIKQLAVAR